MHILITGAAGFLGSKLRLKLLEKGAISFGDVEYPIEKLTLVDAQDFKADTKGIPCHYFTGGINSLLSAGDEYDLVFHLAAVTSSQAEAEFDLGFDVNVAQTISLLNKLRQQGKTTRLVMTSSIAVFGIIPQDPVPELSAAIPNSSYGMEKAICELLIHDYGRRNFVDARVIRLPTIVVRPGKPNAAASSFLSSIIREPLAGEKAECYTSKDLSVWLSSPDTAVYNIIHAASLQSEQLKSGRIISLPGLTVSVGQMIDTLASMKGPEAAARIKAVDNPAVEKIVASWPHKLQTDYAEALGFITNSSFEEIIEEYCKSL